MALKIESVSQLGLTFFGLTSDTVAETRAAIFQQIHQILFHGKGGYDYETIYNMPIWLRRYHIKQINQYFEEQKKEEEKYNKDDRSKNVTRPNVDPSSIYTFKK